MIWKDVEKNYGKEMADKMKESQYLKGITVTMNKKGETDIPEGDIYLAWKDVNGKMIHVEEWD